MFSLKKFYPTPRPIIFMMVIFITMFTTFTVDISLNIIGYLEELEIVEGEILSIEERMFTEKEWKNQYVGYKYVDRPRLVIQLKNLDSTITIDKTTYSRFWEKLLDNTNLGKTAKIYKRNQGEEYRNPMQIEIGDEVILPISFQNKWNVSLVVIFALLIFLCVYALNRNLKTYRRVYLKEDKQYFKEKKYMKIINLWFNI